jgi:hypothetical protein
MYMIEIKVILIGGASHRECIVDLFQITNVNLYV